MKFVSGHGGEDNNMEADIAESGSTYRIKPYGFHGPSETLERFTYFSNPLWKDVVAEPVTVNRMRFDRWTCKVGGRSIQVPDEGTIFVGRVDMDSVPLVVATANWKIAYDVVSFKYGGKTYCDVLTETRIG